MSWLYPMGIILMFPVKHMMVVVAVLKHDYLLLLLWTYIIFCDILEELSKMLEDFGNSKTSQVEVM